MKSQKLPISITSDLPFLKTPELMSKVCGIGENRLRELMDEGQLEYLQNGNRRLLLDEAILDYYRRYKTPVKQCGDKI